MTSLLLHSINAWLRVTLNKNWTQKLFRPTLINQTACIVFSYLRFSFDQAHLTVSVFGRPRNSLEKKEKSCRSSTLNFVGPKLVTFPNSTPTFFGYRQKYVRSEIAIGPPVFSLCVLHHCLNTYSNHIERFLGPLLAQTIHKTSH